MHHLQDSSLNHLQLFERQALILYFIQSKDPSNGRIIKPDQPAHRNTPLGLTLQKQAKRFPVVLPDLKLFGLASFTQCVDLARVHALIHQFLRALLKDSAAFAPMLSGVL